MKNYSLGKNNRLRDDLEIALTSEDIWADFENALGTLNLELMVGRDLIDMWLENFGFYDDEDGVAAEFYMAVEAAAAPISNLVSNPQPTFRRWIEHLEVGTDERPLTELIHPQGKVLDFNYTEFVETLYPRMATPSIGCCLYVVDGRQQSVSQHFWLKHDYNFEIESEANNQLQKGRFEKLKSNE